MKFHKLIFPLHSPSFLSPHLFYALLLSFHFFKWNHQIPPKLWNTSYIDNTTTFKLKYFQTSQILCFSHGLRVITLFIYFFLQLMWPASYWWKLTFLWSQRHWSHESLSLIAAFMIKKLKKSFSYVSWQLFLKNYLFIHWLKLKAKIKW